MSSRSQSLYDRQITIFSPEGKLYQVEYALRAVKGANVTCIGLKGKDCVVVVGQRKVPTLNLHQDKLLDVSSVGSLAHVSSRIGGAFVGMPGDCRAMLTRARMKASEFEAKNGFQVPVPYLAMKIANVNQMYTQHAYMRIHACVGLLAAIDDELGPQLYQFDPAGWYTGNRAAGIGVKEAECESHLETTMKEHSLETEKETIIAAVGTLQQVVNVDFKPQDIEVGVVSVKNPAFRKLDATEIEQYLNFIAESTVFRG